MPQMNSIFQDPLSRRHFIQIMGASFALAGLGSACVRAPYEKIVAYVDSPEDQIPGVPRYFASTLTLGGFAQGVIVETHEGRPTKVDGNPDHPANFGSSDPYIQASVLSLYDPDRSQSVKKNGEIRSWDDFILEMQNEKRTWNQTDGEGVCFLTEVLTSPTLIEQINKFIRLFPKSNWYQFSPVDRKNIYEGTNLAFGRTLSPIYHLQQARVILSLDGAFMDEGPARLAHIRQFTNARRVRTGSKVMNRLYMVEGTPSLTGATADHRLRLNPSEMEAFACALARKIGITESESSGESKFSDDIKKWIGIVAHDLKEHAGRCLVVCGDRQTPALHALTHHINSALGNFDKTVSWIQPVESQAKDVSSLVDQINSRGVNTVFILGGNPVYCAPADIDLKTALLKVKNRIRLSEYPDETAEICQWRLPETHALEAWSDALAFDGTASIAQPACAPFYEGKSAIEFISLLSSQGGASSHGLVRDYWKNRLKLSPFEEKWNQILRDGVIPQTRASAQRPVLKRNLPAVSSAIPNDLEIIFKEDSNVYDGRFSNNGWLQELPRPITKLTWTNAVLISAETAKKNSLENDDEVELSVQDRSVRGSVIIVPGQSENLITVHLGYGRTQAGRVGNRLGFNAYTIRRSSESYFSSVQMLKTGRKRPIFTAQHHFDMDSTKGRDLILYGDLDQFKQNSEKVVRTRKEQESLVPARPYTGAKWGMSIDLNTCIGCNACMIACQSENNIPIVGQDEVARGRSMHWIRVDRYYRGDSGSPQFFFQPIPCMHCENAPCEEVCPTAATSHSSEGLNQMTYNRCVGTRFCSNNCPYKVRRFNFFQYSDMKDSLSRMSKNPDVTVRSRGVMEKCTYCVQRIREVQIRAEVESREVRDGEIITACQASCPAQAIVFGDMNDPRSEVSKLKAEALDYGILEELGTRPRTTYLAKLYNPLPALRDLESGGG